MYKEYQKFGRENFESGTNSLNARTAEEIRDAFGYLWRAYENFLYGVVVPGRTMRERNAAFEALLRRRGLLGHLIERIRRLPEAGLLADLRPRIFREEKFQRTGEKGTDEHNAYASDYERIRSGRSPKEPVGRLLNLLGVIRNNLEHGQKVLPEEWPEMKRRNEKIFRLAAPVQRCIVKTLFETLWADGVFAYGTLRTSSRIFASLEDLVDKVDADYFVSGKLYDCGAYPGLVIGQREQIRGEVLHSAQLHELLRRTDSLEGSDFNRRLFWARPLSPELEEALVWVYEFTGDVSGLTSCPGGVWSAK